ncbi:MAG TPA: class I SAM-dependent methyltransferase [Anaeromyxobacteraceae bacterium]|nr:class I SAM-dependent methyltransferase [Anaeromyxobacteraceae bacterium]
MSAAQPEPRSEVARRATLLHQGVRLAVELHAGSRLSPGVKFEAKPAAPGTIFDRLELADGGPAVEGRCRLAEVLPPDGLDGRLIFLDGVYDALALVAEGRVVDLGAFFQSVPMVMAQKELVRPAFREFVADALYDLSVFRKFFDEQDRLFDREPGEVAAAGQAAVLRAEGPRFFAHLDAHLAGLEAQVRDFTRQEHERHGFYLRRQGWNVILASEFIKRSNLKPRGYAGDAEMMRMIYEHRPVGRFLFNQLMHLHPVSHPAAEAVRYRRSVVPAALREVLAARPASSPVRVFSVASGPAWELQDVFLAEEDASRISVVLLDQDPDAHELARAVVARLERTLGHPLRVEYVADSVRTMLRGRGLEARLGRFDFIYSMGLFDYLTPPVARVVLARLFDLLSPGGVLMVGNYHARNPSRLYMEYWLDWSLYHRTEASLLELAEDLPAARRSISSDAMGCQMFLRLERAW